MKAQLLSPNGALKTGWALTRKHFIVMLGLFLGIMVVSWIVSLLGGSDMTSIRYWLFYIVSLVLSVWFSASMNKIMLNAHAGEEPSFSIFGQMLPKLGGLIVLNVVVSFICMLPMLVGVVILVAGLGSSLAVADFSNPYELGYTLGMMFSGVSGIVSILFSLVALYLVLRLMFTVLAYVDDSSLGVFDAIQRSWSMTHGNMGKIILAVLMMIVLNIIGFIALIVGVVVTLIISAFMIVALYEQIKASEQLAVADEAAAAAEPAPSEPENPAQPQ